MTFDEMIDYKEGDRGFKVKAEDTYGNITNFNIASYISTVPGPCINLPEKPISINTGEIIKLPIKIESVRGVQESSCLSCWKHRRNRDYAYADEW